MSRFLWIVGLIVVLVFFVQNGTLEGHVCVDQKCLGTLNSGFHLGNSSDFATGTQPTKSG